MAQVLMQANIPPPEVWVVNPRGVIKSIPVAENLTGGVVERTRIVNPTTNLVETFDALKPQAKANGWHFLADLCAPGEYEKWLEGVADALELQRDGQAPKSDAEVRAYTPKAVLAMRKPKARSVK